MQRRDCRARAASPRRARGAVRPANLAIVSVPGEFAAPEARKALERGLHALVFSDNVPFEDELALKRSAREGPAPHGAGLRHGAHRGDAARLRQRGAARRHRHRFRLGHRPAGGLCLSRAWASGVRTASASAGATWTSASAGSKRWRRSMRWSGSGTEASSSSPSRPRRGGGAVLERLRAARRKAWCASSAWKAGAARPCSRQRRWRRAKIEIRGHQAREKRKAGCRPVLRRHALHGGRARLQAPGLQGHRFIDLGDDQYTRGRPHPMIEPEMRNEHVAARSPIPRRRDPGRRRAGLRRAPRSGRGLLKVNMRKNRGRVGDRHGAIRRSLAAGREAARGRRAGGAVERARGRARGRPGLLNRY